MLSQISLACAVPTSHFLLSTPQVPRHQAQDGVKWKQTRASPLCKGLRVWPGWGVGNEGQGLPLRLPRVKPRRPAGAEPAQGEVPGSGQSSWTPGTLILLEEAHWCSEWTPCPLVPKQLGRCRTSSQWKMSQREQSVANFGPKGWVLFSSLNCRSSNSATEGHCAFRKSSEAYVERAHGLLFLLSLSPSLSLQQGTG